MAVSYTHLDVYKRQVFIITHDLDTLYAICDRGAVLADKTVIINAPLAEVEQCQQPWIQAYFHGPRARAAQVAATDERRMIKDLSLIHI